MTISPGKKYLKRLPILVLLLVGIAFMINSCNSRKKEASHPEYFDKLFTKADSVNTVDPAIAFTFLDSAYDAFPDPGIIDFFKKYDYISRIYEFQHQYPQAKVYADSMILIIQDHTFLKEFPVYYVKALLAKGLILQREGNYSMALEYCFKARQVLESTTDTSGLSESNTILGYIKYKQKKYNDAIRFGQLAYQEALSCAESHKKIISVQGKLDNLGIYYTAAGKPDSAMYYFNHALDYINEKQNAFPTTSYRNFTEMARGVVYGNEGDAFYFKGDTAAAEKLYLKSIEINSQKRFDNKDAQLTQVKLANLYIASKQLEKARSLLNELKTSLDTIHHTEILLTWYGLQMQYHAAAGQKETAYDLIKPYEDLKDSIANMRQPQIDVEKEYALIKNHYDFILLKKKTEYNALYLAVTIVISVLAILIALMLWFFWRRSKTANTLISNQNGELQLANQNLEESHKQNTRMMRIVAHDLRNPIISTISITSLLLENKDLLQEDKEMLKLMRASAENSIEMISDLLNINTANEELKKQPEDLRVLLQYCVNVMQFKATEKKQLIVLVADDMTLNINKDKMWRVFSNLIANAIKFSPEEATINVRMTLGRNNVNIQVEDQGIGIPAEMKNKVFDLFTDAKRMGTAGEQSFGLGLNISRQIIEAHDGKIWFESTENKGSSFFITLPS